MIPIFLTAAGPVWPAGAPDLSSPSSYSEKAGKFEPVSEDPLHILLGDVPPWRREEFEFYRWQKLQDVVIFDTRSYRDQAALFKRLAFFTEKSGFTGKLLPPLDMEFLHGYNAHNYGAADLALFFTKAEPGSLSEGERMLLKICLKNGIVRKRFRIYFPVKGGVISVSRESSRTLRKHFLVHELFHGIYYDLPNYRNAVADIWKSMTPSAQSFWVLFLSSRNYNVQKRDLVYNEFQAYTFQQDDSVLRAYARERMAPDILDTFPQQSGFIENFFLEESQLFKAAVARLKTSLSDEADFDFIRYRNLLLSQ